MYFSFDFDWYCVHFDITHEEHGNQTGGGLLNGQNLLSSVTKVISRQSLRTDTPFLGSDFGICVVRPSEVDKK